MKSKKIKEKKLAKSITEKGKFRKLLVTKQMNNGWHYYKIAGRQTILGIRMNLSDIYAVCEKGGQPTINPNTKKGIFEWNQKQEIRILTQEEYDEINNYSKVV